MSLQFLDNNLFLVLAAIVITLLAHIIARVLAKRYSSLPTIVTAIVFVNIFLIALDWQYEDYYKYAKVVFDHLLGYVTVLLAVPLATMSFKELPLKKLVLIVLIASCIGAFLPMLLAYSLAMNQQTILAFSTRSVTTPIGLSIAEIINAPLTLANLIIIVSGLIGATLGRLLFVRVTDHRAKGLALGLVAHAFGTVEAWQISPLAGRYAAFGLAVNGLFTAIWLPLFIKWMF